MAAAAIVCWAFGCGGDTVKNAETGQEQSVERPSAVLLSAPGAEAAEPAAAAGKDGTLFTAFVQKNAAGGSDLYVRRFDKGAKTPGEPVRVNPVAGQVRSWQGDPPALASGPGGELYVGWTAKYPGGDRGTILYLSTSSDGGATFGEPVQVNDDKLPASHGMHSLAVGADGTVYAAWLDERYLAERAARSTGGFGLLAFFHHHPTPTPKGEEEPDAELYLAASKDGGKSFGANERLDRNICPCCKTSIAISPSGTVAVGYRKVYEGGFRHITVIAAASGGAFGRPVLVSDDQWQIDACPVSGPALRFADDLLNVAWFSGGSAGEHGIYTAAANDASISAFAPRQLVEAFDMGVSPVWAGDRLLYSSDGVIKLKDPLTAPAEIEKGRNVAAAAADDRIMYTFVESADQQRSVGFGIR